MQWTDPSVRHVSRTKSDRQRAAREKLGENFVKLSRRRRREGGRAHGAFTPAEKEFVVRKRKEKGGAARRCKNIASTWVTDGAGNSLSHLAVCWGYLRHEVHYLHACTRALCMPHFMLNLTVLATQFVPNSVSITPQSVFFLLTGMSYWTTLSLPLKWNQLGWSRIWYGF